MTQPKLSAMRVRLVEGGTRLRLDSDDGTPIGALELDCAQLTALIAGLAAARREMPAARDIPDVEAYLGPAVLDPRWHCCHERQTEGALLRLYDAGHGTLAFVFPRREVEGLAGVLQNILAVPPTPSPGKPN